jgi:hypothetical protein
MMLFELMELEYPFDRERFLIKIKEGEVKPITTNKHEGLIELYNSMKNIVCC